MIANPARRLLSTILAAPRWCLIAVVRVYQVTVSPWLGPVCRYHPTCSEYTIQAIEKYGVLLGMWRGIKRVARCHPFRPGGFDPP